MGTYRRKYKTKLPSDVTTRETRVYQIRHLPEAYHARLVALSFALEETQESILLQGLFYGLPILEKQAAAIAAAEKGVQNTAVLETAQGLQMVEQIEIIEAEEDEQ